MKAMGCTYQPNKRKMKKTHGFFATASKVLKARRAKGRKRLSK